jgi:hypothetical protein
MSQATSLSNETMLVPIKAGDEQGIHFCWSCCGIFVRNELTKHHKIPDRYRSKPGYWQIVANFAEDGDLEGGLIVLVCRKCHDQLNHLDARVVGKPLPAWLEFWSDQGRCLGKNLFRPTALAGLPLSAKSKKRGARKMRRR